MKKKYKYDVEVKENKDMCIGFFCFCKSTAFHR